MKDEHIRPVNRFDLPEWSGAFGDLGTLIPFVVAYIAILGMNPNGLLAAFGISLIAAGFFYRTPFPVQPMKAIGASAVSQASLAAGLTASSVVGAALMTGVIWLLLASTGLCSPQSNGMAESFVNTFKRDYVSKMDLTDARTVLAQLHTAFEHFNEVHPHSSLKMKSPREFRQNQTAKQRQVPIEHPALHCG